MGGGTSTFLQADSLVSRSASQDSEKERRTTVISGRTLSAQLPKSNPVGLLVRTLLESPRWFSPARALYWKAKPIYSVRRRTESRLSNDTSSKQFAKTLSQSDIRSNRLLFLLVPSARHIDGTECFSSQDEPTPELLPTPLSQGLKVCENGKSIPIRLALLPTPRANKVDLNLDNDKLATREKGNLEEVVAKIIQDNKLNDYAGGKGAGKVSLLNPLFVEEMMGFPYLWTLYPFLSNNGGGTR